MIHAEAIPRAPWQPCRAVGWRSQQLKRCFSINLGKMLQNDPSASTDIEVPYLKAQHVQWDGVRVSELPNMWAAPSEVESLQVGIGDLLVCEGGEVGRGSIVAVQPPARTIIQNALHIVRGRATGEPRFLVYLLRHAATQGWFDVLCNRSTIAHFTVDKFGEMWASLPGASQQRAIANYLDRETARLDALVEAKERVLGLLAEKRQALITQAVTRGLDSKAPLRDSGIPWLGKIPEHWRLERAKFVFRQSALPVRDKDEMVTCFRDGQVTLRRNRREEGFTNANLELGYQGIRCGLLVLHSMDAFAGAIGVSDSDGKCSPEYIICDPQTPQVDNYYYGHLLRTMALAGFIQASCPAVRERAPRIRFSGFGEMFIPVPPPGEQRSIGERISIDLSRVDALRSANERTIALLKERRAALIAAAVTGQIDVGAAA